MDELEQKKQQARDAGYSEEEINAYLNVKDTPVPQTAAPNREQEHGAFTSGVALKAAELGAEGYTGYKVAKGLVNAFKGNPSAPVAPTAAPVAAPVAPTPSPILDAAGNPMASAAPKAPPVGGPAAQQGSNFIQSISQKYGQMSDKFSRAGSAIVEGAPQFARQALPYARAGIGVGGALYSPDLGPKVPTKGPLRGSEINPNTGGPWTPQDLAAYESRYR